MLLCFWVEHDMFWNRMGFYNHDNIWPDVSTMEAHCWHKAFSSRITDILAPLACRVTSKILGIGSVERNWKQVKRVKSGQAINTGIEIATKKVIICREYMHMKAKALRNKNSATGKLWTKEDFKYCNMDEYYKEIAEEIEKDNTVSGARIFHAWKETWEKKKVGPNGEANLEARLVKKVRRIIVD